MFYFSFSMSVLRSKASSPILPTPREYLSAEPISSKTNDIDIEEVYTGNETMEKVYWECVKGRERLRTVTLKGHNFLHFAREL